MGTRSGTGRATPGRPLLPSLLMVAAALAGGCGLDNPAVIPVLGDSGPGVNPACGRLGLPCCTTGVDAGACGAELTCREGLCARDPRCPSGQTLCDGLCVDTGADPSHCGRCGNACSNRGGVAVCSMGSCAVRCAAGLADCDGDAANGCEASLSSPEHCGACTTRCSVANGEALCSGGMCGVARCAAGFGNCDGDVANGCEATLNTSDLHCGACGNPCVRGSSGPTSCTAGRCVARCPEGMQDCDNNPANGCEAAVQTDAANCGACGNRCPSVNAPGLCREGRCALGPCPNGLADCDGNLANGCEVDTRVSPQHCGSCGRLCPSSAPTCAAGVCLASNCGGAPGFADCDMNPANGCEANTNTALAHCGSCGRACAPPNATPACAAGQCRVASCTGDFRDCNGNPADGCEVNIGSNTAHCGRCGNPCPAGQYCGLGTCRANSCGQPGQTCCPGDNYCQRMTCAGGRCPS